MALFVHRSSHLLPLVDTLASVLAPVPADPFTPEVVAVPTAGVRDFVRRELARRLGAGPDGDGIAANLELVFPDRLVRRALGVEGDDDPWSVERLTWHVLGVLADPAALPGAALPLPGELRRRAGTARRIADLFDRYATHRPAMLRAWAAGHDRDGTPGPAGALPAGRRWQQRLWCEVRARIGVPSPAERVPERLSGLRSGGRAPELPERVAVFGQSTLAPGLLALLDALAGAHDVHVFLRTPSTVGVVAGVDPSVPRPRAELDVTATVAHPLLRSWGRPALETAALVRATTARCADRPAPPPPPTVLGRLQSGLLEDRPPAGRRSPGERDDHLAAWGDGTVQVHACHGPARQVQVLRDALLHLFRDHPDIEARDVLVLCPDLATYAPLVLATFPGHGADTPDVPVRVADRALTTVNPMAAALHAVLGLVAGRCTATELTALAAEAPVRRRLGLRTDDLELLDRWVGDLGVRWGLRPSDRAGWGLPAALAEGTWRVALDRLLCGAALPAPTPRPALGALAPFDDVGGADLAAAGRVAELLARLEHVTDRLDGDRPIGAWCAALAEVVELLLAPDPDAPWERTEVLELLRTLAEEAIGPAGPCPVPLGLDDVLGLLERRLAGEAPRPDFRSGAVTVTSLVPQRGVPARVVCLLGLDEGVLRASGVDGDDLLLVHPCVGERDARAESRLLLLDAVQAASDVLVVTCTGHDVSTNAPVPFATALDELLDVVAGLDAPAGDGVPVLTHHPRHPFDERALGVGRLHPARPWSFDPLDETAARARRTGRLAPPAGPLVPAPLPEHAGTGEVPLEHLRLALVRPAEVLLRHRLGARPPRRPERRDDALELALGALPRSAVGRELLAHRRAGGSLEGWVEHRALAGDLPPGRLGAADLAEVAAEVEAILSCLHDAAPGDPILHELAVDLDGQRLVGAVDGVVGRVLARPRYASWRPALQAEAALELAALARHDPACPWSAVVVTRDGRGKKPKVATLRLAGDDPAARSAAAARVLRLALVLLGRARCEALPLFGRASAGVWWGVNDLQDLLDRDAGDDATRLAFGRVRVEALDEVPCAPGDPWALPGIPRWRALARHVWHELDAAVVGLIK